MHRFYATAVAMIAFPLLHCGLIPIMPPPAQGAQDPSAATGAPETTGAGYTPSAAQRPSGGPGAAPGAPQAKSAGGPSSPPFSTTVEIHSDCSKTTPVFYGEKPKFGSGTKSSISSNSTTSAGRKSDGTLTVWIIDEQENGIASVRVEPTTKRVDIDRSCRHITAR